MSSSEQELLSPRPAKLSGSLILMKSGMASPQIPLCHITENRFLKLRKSKVENAKWESSFHDLFLILLSVHSSPTFYEPTSRACMSPKWVISIQNFSLPD